MRGRDEGRMEGGWAFGNHGEKQVGMKWRRVEGGWEGGSVGM